MYNWINNYKESSRKFTLKNIWNYLVTQFRWYKVVFFGDNGVLSYLFYLRVLQANESCLELKYCPCYCDIPQKFLEDEGCDDKCYKSFISEKELLNDIIDYMESNKIKSLKEFELLAKLRINKYKIQNPF